MLLNQSQQDQSSSGFLEETFESGVNLFIERPDPDSLSEDGEKDRRTAEIEMPNLYPKFMKGVGRSQMIDTSRFENVNTFNEMQRTTDIGYKESEAWTAQALPRPSSQDRVPTLDQMHILTRNSEANFSFPTIPTVADEMLGSFQKIPSIARSLEFRGMLRPRQSR